MITIVYEVLLDTWSRFRRAQRLAKAQSELLLGHPTSMQSLADTEDLGDAWLALAVYFRDHEKDEVLATRAFGAACRSHEWLHRQGACCEEYARRRFLGIGCACDHRGLVEKWFGAGARIAGSIMNLSSRGSSLWVRTH